MISLAPQVLFHIGGFPVTNTLITTVLVSLILLAIAFLYSRKQKRIPGRFQAAVEAIFEGFLSFMDSITQDRKKTVQVMPVVVTLFLFILLANWIEVVPGVESIFVNEKHTATEEAHTLYGDGKELGVWVVGEEAHAASEKENGAHGEAEAHGGHISLLRSPSSDLNMTLSLAALAILFTQFIGIKTLGAFAHLGKYFSMKRNPVEVFVGLLEALGEVSKIISLAFRLFGNIFAGGVLLIVVGGLVPFFAPLPFLGLEIFVGIVQALVFSVLTLVFITMATEHH